MKTTRIQRENVAEMITQQGGAAKIAFITSNGTPRRPGGDSLSLVPLIATRSCQKHPNALYTTSACEQIAQRHAAVPNGKPYPDSDAPTVQRASSVTSHRPPTASIHSEVEHQPLSLMPYRTLHAQNPTKGRVRLFPSNTLVTDET